MGYWTRANTELCLFATKGAPKRLDKGVHQVVVSPVGEHSRKPDEQYDIIEACSWGPYLEMFARGARSGWSSWGNEAKKGYRPSWKTYAHHSQAHRIAAE